MPDAYGNFKGMSVPADAWDRIFGTPAPPEPDPRCPWQYPAGECPIPGCLANDDNDAGDR